MKYKPFSLVVVKNEDGNDKYSFNPKINTNDINSIIALHIIVGALYKSKIIDNKTQYLN